MLFSFTYIRYYIAYHDILLKIHLVVGLDRHVECNERRDSSTQPLTRGGEDSVVGMSPYP